MTLSYLLKLKYHCLEQKQGNSCFYFVQKVSQASKVIDPKEGQLFQFTITIFIYLLKIQSHSVAQAAVQWHDLGSLQTLPLGFK